MLRTRLERETGPVDERIREAITMANNEIHRLAASRPEWLGMACVLTVAVVQGRDRDHRTRRRRAPVQAAARPHREGHAGSLAGRRAGGRGRDRRAGGDAAPAPQRGLPRRGLRAPCGRRPGLHRDPDRAVRAGRGAAAVQRRLERPGALGRHRPARGASRRRSRGGGPGPDRGGQRGRRQGQRHGAVRARPRLRGNRGARPGTAGLRAGVDPGPGLRRIDSGSRAQPPGEPYRNVRPPAARRFPRCRPGGPPGGIDHGGDRPGRGRVACRRRARGVSRAAAPP